MTGAPEPTSVYLYHDQRAVLLYVGITKQGPGRQSQHNAVAEWWRYVAGQQVEHYDTREEAKARETWLIKAKRPPFNRQENPDWRELRHAYLTLFDPEMLRLENADSRRPRHGAVQLLWARHAYKDCADADCLWGADVMLSEGCEPGCWLCHAMGHHYDEVSDDAVRVLRERLQLALHVLGDSGNGSEGVAARGLVKVAGRLVALLGADDDPSADLFDVPMRDMFARTVREVFGGYDKDWSPSRQDGSAATNGVDPVGPDSQDVASASSRLA